MFDLMFVPWKYVRTNYVHKFKFDTTSVHDRLLKTPEYSQYFMSLYTARIIIMTKKGVMLYLFVYLLQASGHTRFNDQLHSY